MGVQRLFLELFPEVNCFRQNRTVLVDTVSTQSGQPASDPPGGEAF